MERIYLSPSNQTSNVGKYHGNYKNECEMAEAIAACAKEYLERNYECEVMIAERSLNMQKRIQEAQEWEATVYLPIHTNAFNGIVRGVDTYYSNTQDSREFAKVLAGGISDISGHYHGCKSGSYYECRTPTWCTHAYLEVDYHDNAEAAEWLMSNPTLIGEKIGETIAVYKKIPEVKIEITEEEKNEVDEILNPSEEIKMEESSNKTYAYFVGRSFDTKEEALAFSDALNVIGFEASILPIEAYDETEDEAETEEVIEEEPKELSVGDMIRISSDAKDLNRKVKFSSFIYGKYLYVRAISGDRITVSTLSEGAVTGVVDVSSIESILYKED